MARRKAGDDKALDELYLGDFETFTARRNELAKQMRAQGAGEGANAARTLRKPSRAAWAINQFSAGDATVRDELLGAARRYAKRTSGCWPARPRARTCGRRTTGSRRR